MGKTAVLSLLYHSPRGCLFQLYITNLSAVVEQTTSRRGVAIYIADRREAYIYLYHKV
jgi:hypothetical protein